LMSAALCVWGMTVLAGAEPAKTEPASLPSSAAAVEGTWIPNAHFTFLKMGSCMRTYRCVAPDKIQAGASQFTSPPKKQMGMCKPGVDSLDYCGLCETDEPKERCTYNLK